MALLRVYLRLDRSDSVQLSNN